MKTKYLKASRLRGTTVEKRRNHELVNFAWRWDHLLISVKKVMKFWSVRSVGNMDDWKLISLEEPDSVHFVGLEIYVCFFLYKVEPASPISLWRTNLQSQRTFVWFSACIFSSLPYNFKVTVGLFKKRPLVLIAVSVVMCISFALVHRLLVFSRHSRLFIA